LEIGLEMLAIGVFQEIVFGARPFLFGLVKNAKQKK